MERRRLQAPVFRSRKSGGAAVGELLMLEMAADVFGRIELGRVGRQLFDLEGTVQCFQTVAHESRPVRWQAVPDDQQRLSDLPAEGMQEFDDLRALDGAREESEVEAPQGDASDDGQLMPVEVVLLHCDTVVRVTPTRRATSACVTARWSSRPARGRSRCSDFASRSDLPMARLATTGYRVGQRNPRPVASHLCKSQRKQP